MGTRKRITSAFYSTDNKNQKFNHELRNVPKKKSAVQEKIIEMYDHIKSEVSLIKAEIKSNFKELASNFDIYDEDNPHKFNSFKSHARIATTPARFLEED